MDGSKTHELLNCSSDTSSDSSPISAEYKSILVSEATVGPEVLPDDKKTVQVQEATASAKCKEAVLVNANYVLTQDYSEDMGEFEKTTIFTSKCYKVDVRLIQSEEVHRNVTAVLDSGAGPNLVRQDVIPTSLIPLIKPIKTSVRSAGDTTFNVNGVIRLPIEFEREVINVVLGIAPILATKMILGTAFIDKPAKSIEPQRCRMSPEVADRFQFSHHLQTALLYSPYRSRR